MAMKRLYSIEELTENPKQARRWFRNRVRYNPSHFRGARIVGTERTKYGNIRVIFSKSKAKKLKGMV